MAADSHPRRNDRNRDRDHFSSTVAFANEGQGGRSLIEPRFRSARGSHIRMKGLRDTLYISFSGRSLDRFDTDQKRLAKFPLSRLQYRAVKRSSILISKIEIT